MDVEKATVGELLREIRKQKNMTQKELGLLCNMSDAQVRQYELGIRSPNYKTLFKIANALEVPVSTFLFFDGGYVETNQINKIGERIRELRWEKGLSEKELADFCGVSEFDITIYEVRSTQINNLVFSKIARALDVSETYLMFGSENPLEEVTLDKAIENFFYDLRNKVQSYTSSITINDLEMLRKLNQDFLFLNDIGRGRVLERIEVLKEFPEFTDKK